jgi:hypothetical protein
MSSILGYTLTEGLSGKNTFSQNRISYKLPSPKCIGYSGTRQNSPQATKFSYIKQYSNQSGLMEYNVGVWLPLST